jgi:DnaJ-class molecular chaperone
VAADRAHRRKVAQQEKRDKARRLVDPCPDCHGERFIVRGNQVAECEACKGYDGGSKP